ncbi:hypothetical protein Tco_1570414 [Tanacetum coccineum]
MGRDTIQLENAVSTISQEYLLEFSSEYFIPENLHPELPYSEDHIVDFPKGKIGVYTKKIKFANFRIPISQFLFDILGYYQIHLSQLSVIGAAKVSHFEINCRVDEKVFPTVMAWRTAATKYDKPQANTYSVVDVATLDTHRTPFQKQPEELLCLVGLSRNFFLHDDEYPTFLNDNDQEMDLFNLIKAPNPTKVKTGTRQRAAHEVPLMTATASRVIQMVDAAELSTSSGTPSTVERSPLDFSNEDAPPPVTQGIDTGVHGSVAAEQEIPMTDDAGATEATVEPNLEKEMISMGPTIRKRRRQRDAGEEGPKAPAKVLRKDHDIARAEHSARGGKSLAGMSVDTGLALHAQKTQEPPIATQTVNDPNPLSYAKPLSQQDVTQSSKEKGIAGDQDSEKIYTLSSYNWDVVDHIAPPGYFSELRHLPNDEFLSQYNMNLARQVAMGSQLRLRFEQEAKLLKKYVAHVARCDQMIATREKHIKELEAQLEAEINMKKATEVKNSEVTKELEDLRMRFSGLEVGNAQLSQQVSVLQAQVMGEKRIMAAFEEFKKHEDERVSARCAEMDARLDALSVDFDEELYPHMLTAIAGRRWVIGHGLRLAVMKCAESTELRQAFANVVSAGIAKGMSEGLKYGVEHGKAGLELTAVEAYDPEADNKYVAALHNLKDLSYPLIDELEQLKDAPLDVIMASLYLESDTGEDAPQSIRDLRSSSPSSRFPLPTVAPQGLQILLADAATQTEDKESPRLLRSKSLPALFTLDLP